MESYNGLTRKGMSMSKSSPCLAASFKLREYSQSRKHLPNEQSASVPKLPALEEIDRIGGNGRRRQLQAEEYFKQKEVEDAARLKEERALAAQKQGRVREKEARRRRQQQEMEERLREKEERLQIEADERAEHLRLEGEHKRQIHEAEHNEWLRRQPVTCEECTGAGLCTTCEGSGHVHAIFLVTSVDKASAMLGRSFGRNLQGCTHCGGCRQNLVGDVQKGSGQCPGCNGKGKVWPDAAFEPKKSMGLKLHHRRMSTTHMSLNMGSPKAYTSTFGSTPSSP
mmetsp:Transcript_102661/g.260778  ORF Transcript_102661/g.260778 Transcript_102661/m.260778 type:complete len:282 (+) Transcript_102661:73-918(+)